MFKAYKVQSPFKKKRPKKLVTQAAKKRTVVAQNNCAETLAEIFSAEHTDKYLIIDLETTGLEADSRIVEITLMRTSGEVAFTSLVNPGIPIPYLAWNTHHISDSMVEDAPTLKEILPEIKAVVNGCTLIAWNSSYDELILKNDIARTEEYFAQPRFICAMKLYAKQRGIKSGRCALYKAKSQCGYGMHEEHRSTSDCLDTLTVLRTLRDQYLKGQ